MTLGGQPGPAKALVAVQAALLPVALYGLALAVRWAAMGGPPAGDEAVHYYVARTLGTPPGNVNGIWDSAFLFWQRPFFSLIYFPAAQAGFDAYRIANVLVAAALAPLTMMVLRSYRVRLGLALAAGGAVALHPIFVTWGSRVFPDSTMTVLLALALLLHAWQKYVASALAFLLAAWTKEVAIVGIAAQLGLSVATSWRSGAMTHRRLLLSRSQVCLIAALFLSPLPLVYSTRVRGWLFPGWGRGGYTLELLDLLFVSGWFLLFLLWGWFRRPREDWATWPFVFPLFFLVYRFFFDGAVGGWYIILPAWFVMVGLAFLVDRELEPGPGSPSRRRRAAIAAGIAVLVVLAADMLVPVQGRPYELLHPLGGERERYRSLPETFASAGDDVDGLLATVELIGSLSPTDLFLVDVGWYYVYYPFASLAPHVAFGLTDGPQGALLTTFDGGRYTWEGLDWNGPAEAWRANAERPGTLTVVAKTGTELNHALRGWYADCVVRDIGAYVVLDASGCVAA